MRAGGCDMPSPLPIRAARERFYGVVAVIDIADGRIADGEWIPGARAEREIPGSFQSAHPLALHGDPSGDAGIGRRELYTRELLPFYDPDSAAQTLVKAEGVLWRVAERRDWGAISQGLRVYVCERYQDDEALPTGVPGFGVSAEAAERLNATDVRSVEKALVRVLRDNLYGGEELVVIEPFNGPRPKGPYASLLLTACKPEAHEVFEYEDRGDDELRETVKGERYCTARISFYNSTSRQKAADCQNLLRSSNRNFDLTPITGFGEIGEFENATAEILGRQEERAVLAVEFYANLSAAYLSNNIEAVKGNIVHEGATPHPYAGGGDSCRHR